MNNLAYNTQQPEKVAAQVEEKLRKELTALDPIPYQIETGGASATSAGTVMTDVVRGLFGGSTELLFTLVFDMSQPRPAQLRARVDRQGVGCHVGTLLYSTRLSIPIAGNVELEAPKTFGNAKFTGDADIAARLNAKGDLLKRLGKLARKEAEIGGLTIRTERMVKLTPQDGGALVLISTLPRPTSMGMDATLDAKEFFELVGMLEETL